MTNVPMIQWTPTGPIAPTEAQILAGVTADLAAAFGPINPALETPQGQLASTWTAIIADFNAQIIAMVDQFDPNYASGANQDALGQLYFLTRNPATATAVQCTCIGLSGTVIPAGAQASDTNGNVYQAVTTGTIPAGGSLVLEFQNVVTGPIACPTGTLTTIYQAIPGWDSISNPAAGVEGSEVEGQAAFEARRVASVALNASGTVDAIKANVAALNGVLSVYAVDNPTSAPATVGGVTLAANSLYVVVVGGAAQEIAQAIFEKKSGGCSLNGQTSVIVTDPQIGSDPLPQYTISFDYATEVPMAVSVQIQKNSALSVSITSLIQDAILAAFAGTDGGPAVSIGSDIFASRFYDGVKATDPNCRILSIQVSPQTQFTGSISNNTLTVTAMQAGALAVGQTVQGSGVASGTTITALGTGTGGVGTYTLSSAAQNIASEALTAVLLVNMTPFNINQIGSISASAVQVAQV